MSSLRCTTSETIRELSCRRPNRLRQRSVRCPARECLQLSRLAAANGLDEPGDRVRVFQPAPLVRPADPGILPPGGDILVVSAKADVVAIAVTDLHRLVFAQRDRSCDADAGARLTRSEIRYAIQAGNAAEPEISVQRKPQPWLYIVTQVAFEGSDGLLGLRLRRWG